MEMKDATYSAPAVQLMLFGLDAEEPRAQPPSFGEKILYLFLSKDDRECMPGDLAEEFSMLADKHGLSYAKFWYWKQVIFSIIPIIFAYIRKIVSLAFVAKLYDFVRGIF